MAPHSLLPLLPLVLAACASSWAPVPESPDRTGTNPLVLATTAELAQRYVSFGDGDDGVELLPAYQHALAEGRMRLGLLAPVRAVEVDGQGAAGLGDLALRYEWLADRDDDAGGVVLRTDIGFDTASEDLLGASRTIIAPALTSVHALSEASLLAFTYAQRFTVDGTSGDDAVNRGELAARYVRTSGEFARWWLVEPGLVVDFEDEAETWGSLGVERGWLLGDVRGGGLGAFVRPELGVGGRREQDWSLLLGLRLVGL